ncbi:intradiol ring-cleavage dioxygenase [Kineosporia mesophila]|uniref:Intradiol ring-cleavage dioxygenase n=1 Tax=Kineosporia mesophila TaxID=566012 RepID=A0ABP7ACG2_9ACTN|nr:intradiol ring-cleavage dioxygenase [Kineosporia mesophila]MCD5351306.1 intradiol ring-cleavage dioxygenase [Kineosporia mesophila]
MTTSHEDEPGNDDVSAVLLSRRKVFAVGGVAGAGLLSAWGVPAGTGASASGNASVSAAEAAGACLLTSEQIEGPYYLDNALLRSDITEDRTGIPLDLELRLIDGSSCKPVKNAAIEIWHCDGQGVYSGYASQGSGGTGEPGSAGPPTGMPTPSGPPPTGTPSGTPGGPPTGGGGGGHVTPTDDLTFLRGMQITDRHGRVAFASIVPGWYAGRAVHIHVKVHTEGSATATGYTGGHTCHTGQLYFGERLIALLDQYPPYSENTTPRTTLEQDSIYPGTGSAGGLLTLNFHQHRTDRGVTARLTVSVDPGATNEGEDAGGGPVPSGGPTTTPAA